MTVDRIGSQSGGFTASAYRNRQRVQHAAAQPRANDPLDLGGDSTRFGLTMGTGRGLSDSFHQDPSLVHTWGARAAVWSGRDWAAKTVDKALTQTVNVSQKIDNVERNLFEQMGAKFSNSEINTEVVASKETPKTIYNLFHPANQSIPIKELKWGRFTDTVKSNVSEARNLFQSGEIHQFAREKSLKEHTKAYFKDQIKPIKTLFSNEPDKQVGTGLFRSFAIGLVATDIIKHGKQTYQQAKAQEDGSFKSKLHTWKETLKTVGKYTLRSATTWEAAGLGMAIGKIVLPVSMGVLPIGGILAGAFAGAMAQKTIDPILKTGTRDPNAQKTEPLSDKPPDLSSNPFKAGFA